MRPSVYCLRSMVYLVLVRSIASEATILWRLESLVACVQVADFPRLGFCGWCLHYCNHLIVHL